MDLPRILVVAILAGIILSLGSAMFFLSSSKNDSKKMLRALTLRIGLSVGLFFLLLILWRLGFIQPHGLGG